MERSLMLIILVMGAVWLLLDEFKGERRITSTIKAVME